MEPRPVAKWLTRKLEHQPVAKRLTNWTCKENNTRIKSIFRLWVVPTISVEQGWQGNKNRLIKTGFYCRFLLVLFKKILKKTGESVFFQNFVLLKLCIAYNAHTFFKVYYFLTYCDLNNISSLVLELNTCTIYHHKSH